jgi:predicted acyltransferase
MQHGLQPLVIFGMNALFLFVLSGLVAKLLLFWKVAPNVALKAAIYASMQDWGMSAVNTSLAFALCFVASMYGVAWWMWRNNWFVKV